MTLLRRIAQLVQDLRTIGAIREEDKIFSNPFGSKFSDTNCISLTIQFEREDEQSNRRLEHLIGECISEEFSEAEWRVEEYSEEGELSVVFFRKI